MHTLQGMMDTYLWEYPADMPSSDVDNSAMKLRNSSRGASSSNGCSSKAYSGPHHEASSGQLVKTAHQSGPRKSSGDFSLLPVSLKPPRLPVGPLVTLSEEAHEQDPSNDLFSHSRGSPRRPPPAYPSSPAVHALMPTDRLLRLLGRLGEGPLPRPAGSGSVPGVTREGSLFVPMTAQGYDGSIRVSHDSYDPRHG